MPPTTMPARITRSLLLTATLLLCLLGSINTSHAQTKEQQWASEAFELMKDSNF